MLHFPCATKTKPSWNRLSDAPQRDVQIEADVEEAGIKFRPKRMLVCRVRDGDEILHLRFFNFYPSQQKQLVPGARLRLLGELRKGFFGAEMVHPRYRVLSGEEALPQSLTPVYPTTAGLPQTKLRKLVERELDAADLSDTLPSDIIAPLQRLRSSKASPTCNPPPLHASTRWRRTHQPGAASSSTNCWPSNCPCACTIGSGRRWPHRGSRGSASFRPSC